MRWYSRLLLRNRTEHRLDAELRFHLEQQIADYIAAGMAPREARRRARLEFGGIDQVKEECRDVGRGRFVENLIRDMRFGLRRLMKNPAFTSVAVLSLALGIGANTAIFALVDAVMLRSLPVRQPQQLVQFICTYHQRPHGMHSGYGSDGGEPTFSYPLFQHLRQDGRTLTGIFAFVPLGFSKENVSVIAGKDAGMADGEMVSGGYFSQLGVNPILGRAIGDGDEQADAPHVAVISYGYWTIRFGRNPAIVGSKVTVGGQPTTVIGVAPPEFYGVQPGRSVDVWLPLSKYTGLQPWGVKAAGNSMFDDGDWWWLLMMGRLKPDVSLAQAQAELELAFQDSAAATLPHKPKPEDALHLALVPAAKGLDMLRDQYSQPLHILAFGVLLVLLIACANIATLLLAGSHARAREIAVRLSLGAARPRLISQLLSESLLLAIIGGALGMAVAFWGARVLARLLVSDGSLLALVHINGLVLAFTTATSLLTAILLGLAPAMVTTRLDLVPALKEAPGTEAHAVSRFTAGKVLVVGQIAISLVLLVGAGLMVRTLYNLEHENLGFRQQNLLVFQLDGTQTGYSGAKLTLLYEGILDRLRRLPGITAATNSGLALLNGWENDSGFAVDTGKEQPQGNGALWNIVGFNFFQTLGIPVVLGRGIEASDIDSTPKVVVVNAAFAKKLFDDRNPIGHRVSRNDKFDPADSAEVVGVVGNAKYNQIRGEFPPTVYYPAAQMPEASGSMYFELRTTGDPLPLVSDIRRTIRDIEPNLPLANIKTETQQMAEDLVEERMFARLATFFGLAALLLSCIGLYGTMAYRVIRRTHEIGIRLALGAARASVLVHSLVEAIVLAAFGIAIGLPASIVAARVIASTLYGVTASDRATLAASAVSVLLVAFLAAWLPARRAASVDPLVALRYE